MTKFFKRFLSNEKFVTKGFLVAVLIILAAVGFTNYDVLASKNDDHAYGYYSGEYGYGYRYSSNVPSAPANFTCTAASSTSLTCSWTEVTTSIDGYVFDNFSYYKVYYSTSAVNRSTGTLGATVTSRSTVSASITGLTGGTGYNLAVYAVDDNGNYSAASNTHYIVPSGSTATGGGGSGGGSSTIPAVPATPAVPGVSPAVPATPAVPGEPTVGDSTPTRPATPNLGAEQTALQQYSALTGGHMPSNGAGWSVIHFLAYGATYETEHMSQRDRGGLLDDFEDVYGRLPGFGQSVAMTGSEQDWVDLAKIAKGMKPTQRNLDRERLGIKEFVKIYKRLPVFKNASDDMAVQYIAYRLRPATRTLALEKTAISTFKGLYGKNPYSAHDWAVVRAMAYNSAK